MKAITYVGFGYFTFISRWQGTCYYAEFCHYQFRYINDYVAFRTQFYVYSFRLGFSERIYVRCDFYEDVKSGIRDRTFRRRIGTIGRVIDSEVLIRDFLVRRSVVVSFFVRGLV